jgi:hypothetical protein
MLRPMRATPLFLTLALAATARAEAPDPLAAEIARWTAVLEQAPAGDELWAQARPGLQPALADAASALKAGHRLLALYRLARAQEDLGALQYVTRHDAAARGSQAAFESEWTARRDELSRPLTASSLRPALVRALAEAAAAQSTVYAKASLDYARSTTAESGYYYLGAALADREMVAIGSRLASDAEGTLPPVRDLQPDIDGLRGELLAAYRPPASLDRHREFISASSALKEASELNAAGLRYAALLRYMVGAQRAAPLVATEAPGARGLTDWEHELAKGKVDHTIARLFLELAAAGDAPTKAIVAGQVLPRYAAALQPAGATPAGAPASVTVTLVRWPYT